MALGNGLPTQEEVAATVVNSSDSICTALIKVFKSYVFAYRYVKYKYDSSGKISGAFCGEIKACVALNQQNTNPTA